MSENIYANTLLPEGTNALKVLVDRKLSLLGLVLAWSTSLCCGPGGSVDVCPALGRLLRIPLPPPWFTFSSGGFLYRNWETCWCFTGGMTIWLYLGPDQAIIPDIEWMNQILLAMGIVNSGNLVEITFFQEPHFKITWRAWPWAWPQSIRNTVPTMKWKNLRSSWRPEPQPPVPKCCKEHYDNRSVSATTVQKKQIPLNLTLFLPLPGRTVVGLFWCRCEWCFSK